jgi:hypothetical protein
MQSPRGTPHPEAVVHQQLHPRRPCIGEQPAVVRLCTAYRVDHHRQQPVGARAHVLRLGAQPQRVDADHRLRAHFST